MDGENHLCPVSWQFNLKFDEMIDTHIPISITQLKESKFLLRYHIEPAKF